MLSYRLSREALTDLESIARYLRKKASEEVAIRVVQDILSGCDELAELKALGHKRADFTSKNVRFHVVWRYLIVFQRLPDTVIIHGILHSARDLPAVLRKRHL